MILLALLVTPSVRGQAEKQPVPNSAKQGPVLYKLKNDYKADYAKREAPDQLALAATFLKEAKQPGVEAVRKYVLLREARELAVNGGDLGIAFDAIDEMARDFAVDPTELKVTAMANSVSRSRAPPLQMMEQYLKIAEQSLADWDVQTAYQASRLGTKVARESKDAGSIGRAKQVELHVNEMNRQVKVIIAAADKLKARPDDAEANLTVGRYWCFLRGNFEEGLPLLAKGSDSQLADLARQDLSAPQNPKAMLKLADAWWNLPDSLQAPQRRSRQRAAHWYGVALPQLQGAEMQTARQRLASTQDK
jgi:hypothetical protein